MSSKQKNCFDLVVVGAGAGGLSVAAGAARFGLSVLLIEKNKLGGDCLWVGCVPSKTLIHEAGHVRVMKEEGVHIDPQKHFKNAIDRVKDVQQAIAEHDSKERFEGLGVEVVFGSARFSGASSVFVGESEYTFRKCVIATGSRPFVPDVFKNIKYYNNENIFNLDKLPESMIVVGGGSVGMEIASAFASFGSKVSLVEAGPQLMGKEEPEVAEFMQKKLVGLGVEVFTNYKVLSAKEINGKVVIEIKKEEELLKEVSADMIFIATGRVYNTDLDLEKAGVEYTQKGIIINDYLGTTNKNIYAIGDVNGKMLFTHAAGYQAKAVLQNMFVPLFKKKFLPKAFPWVTYTYPEVAHVGMYKKDLLDKGIQYKEYITPLESVDRARAHKIQKDGFIQVLVGSRGKILGVTIVSPFAGELITEWVLAMENNLSVEKIYNTVHAYPTLSELNPRGTFAYMEEKLSSSLIRLAKFFFRFF